MAFATVLISIASAAVGAMGSIAQANAAASAAKYNAAIAERNRKSVLSQTYAEIEDRRGKNRKMLGQLRAAYAANGLEMSGSPLDVMSDTIEEQEYDVAKVKYMGKVKAQGFAEQRTLFNMEAKSAKTAGYIGAAAAMLGAAGDIASDGFGSSKSLYGDYA